MSKQLKRRSGQRGISDARKRKQRMLVVERCGRLNGEAQSGGPPYYPKRGYWLDVGVTPTTIILEGRLWIKSCRSNNRT